jgi:endonuclease YncB( thermonuclease family)
MASLLHPFLWPILLLLATPATRPAGDAPALAMPDLSAAPLVTVLGIDDANQITVQQQDGTRFQARLACLQPSVEDARQAAMVFLRNLLVGEKVWLVRAAPGPDSDATWYVYRSPDRLFVNIEAVRQGYADVLPEPNGSAVTSKAIAYWRDQARHTNKGIWVVTSAMRPAAPQPPAILSPVAPASQASARAVTVPDSADPEATTVYVSSSSSGKKYHRANCGTLRKGGKPIPLEQARKSHEPCKLCKPPQ